MFQSFLSIVLVLCLVSLVGPSALNLLLVLGLLGWTGIARLVYGNTLSVREKEYVLAARALGGRTGRILRSNVLPNVIAPVWCAFPLRAGRAILSESSLSFLGVGIRTPQASWGNLIQYAASLPVLTGRPWVWVPPGLCIILTVLCLQGIGDGLRALTLDMADTGGNSRIFFLHGLFCAIINLTERSGLGSSRTGAACFICERGPRGINLCYFVRWSLSSASSPAACLSAWVCPPCCCFWRWECYSARMGCSASRLITLRRRSVSAP